MATIVTKQAHEVSVDDAWYPILSKHVWWSSVTPEGNVYAFASFNGTNVLMHRAIMFAPPMSSVDHKNGNTLDNRECNLRFASAKEQSRNRRKPNTGRSKSKFKGVSFCDDHWRRKPWRARIYTDRTRATNLGYFETEAAAAIAYDAAAERLFGGFARPNMKKLASA